MLLPVQDVGARHLGMLGAHESEFDLILDVLDMQEAITARATRQRGHDIVGHAAHGVVDTGRGTGLSTLDGEEGLADGNRDLRCVECRNGAVAPDDTCGRRGRGRRQPILGDW